MKRALIYDGMSVICWWYFFFILKGIFIPKSGVKIAIKINHFKSKIMLIPSNRKGPNLWRNERYLMFIMIDFEGYFNPELLGREILH